jgi:hypothetical protein
VPKKKYFNKNKWFDKLVVVEVPLNESTFNRLPRQSVSHFDFLISYMISYRCKWFFIEESCHLDWDYLSVLTIREMVQLMIIGYFFFCKDYWCVRNRKSAMMRKTRVIRKNERNRNWSALFLHSFFLSPSCTHTHI